MRKDKTKRNKENSKYFDKSVIRTINNVFIVSEWCDWVVSCHFKELKELSSHLVRMKMKQMLVQMTVMEIPCSSLLWKNRHFYEWCDNITKREVAFDGELVVCAAEEVFLTHEGCAAHRVVLNAINNVQWCLFHKDVARLVCTDDGVVPELSIARQHINNVVVHNNGG